MIYLIMFMGMLLGIIVFSFTFIATKKNAQYYLAPIITFLLSIGITAYGLFAIGGFEGMAFGILAFGFLIVSILGTIILPFLTRKQTAPQQLKKRDKISLIVLPILFFTIITGVILFDKNYWIIEQGTTTMLNESYEVSTILEGRKEVSVTLGDDYLGKIVDVKKVTKRGPTTITLKIKDGEKKDQTPFIRIGLDEINEPLTIQTTDGKVLFP